MLVCDLVSYRWLPCLQNFIMVVMILYEGGELWPELASCHFSFPSGQSIVTVLHRDGICWRGKESEYCSNDDTAQLPGSGLSCFSCALYPTIQAPRTAISHNQESEWSGHRRVERQGGHCHLVISRHTAINTSYFSPGLANWTITRECVVTL